MKRGCLGAAPFWLPATRLSGRIDLILRTRDGTEFILDIKYGKSRYANQLEQGFALQLAAYAEARKHASGEAEAPPAAYFSLKGKDLLATDAARSLGRPALSGPPVSMTWRRAEKTLQVVRGTLEQGRVPVTSPRPEHQGNSLLKVMGVTSEEASDHLVIAGESACQYCGFSAVCGTAWERSA